MSSTQVRAQVVRSFSDAGTEKTYATGAEILLDAGVFQNYRAAGLVTAAPDATTEQVAPEPAAKPRPKPAKSNEIPPAAKAE